MGLNDDKFYQRIKEKIENGTFIKGNNCKLTRYYFERETIKDFPLSERTPEICTSLMDYGKCHLRDVPMSSRTREFYIANFTNKDVNNYIKNHIEEFDKQFFKDLIETNKYATSFDTNCFTVMPLEYIDEEMCSLGIMKATGWNDFKWFYTVYERKPEALTEDLWKLGARLYSLYSSKSIKFINITPNEYKDKEYYRQVCLYSFNYNSDLIKSGESVMDLIPEEFLTVDFLLDLLKTNKESIGIFNEKSLETEITYTKFGEEITEKIWQYAIKLDGYLIKYIDLNDERIEYFLSHYYKNSTEYEYGFKDKYKRYKKEKEDKEALKKKEERTRNYYQNVCGLTLFGALAFSELGEDPTQAIEDVTELTKEIPYYFLPIKYQGIVPECFRYKYDREEYLEFIYKKLGIEIQEEYDYLFYETTLPNGWFVVTNGYWNELKDINGETILTYFYDSKFYDRDAYVKEINETLEQSLLDEFTRKLK